MIEQKTVFVLGAGAHQSYNFPSGAKLKSEVAARLKGASTRTDNLDLMQLIRLGHTKGKVLSHSYLTAMGEAISQAGQLSIDAYLNNNRHLEAYGIFGKATIAQVLLEYEARLGNGGATDDDWLAYLFPAMIRGCRDAGPIAAEDFAARNGVSFVTFNYDRFLETWLHSRLKSSFGLTDEDALKTLRKIEICHVFGALGDYPHTWDSKSSLPWIDACQRIKLIHEAEKEHKDTERAKALLEGAHVICVLGFGFHEENISVINLDAAVRDCKGFVAASRYTMTDTEWKRVAKPFPSGKVRIASEGCKCLMALQNLEVF